MLILNPEITAFLDDTANVNVTPNISCTFLLFVSEKKTLIHISIHTSIYIHIHINKYVHIYIHVYMCTLKHLNSQTHTHTHTHTHIHTHTHTHLSLYIYRCIHLSIDR